MSTSMAAPSACALALGFIDATNGVDGKSHPHTAGYSGRDGQEPTPAKINTLLAHRAHSRCYQRPESPGGPCGPMVSRLRNDNLTRANPLASNARMWTGAKTAEHYTHLPASLTIRGLPIARRPAAVRISGQTKENAVSSLRTTLLFVAQWVSAGLAVAFIAVLIRPDLLGSPAARNGATGPGSPSFADAAASAAPSVVNIYISRKPAGNGSGSSDLARPRRGRSAGGGAATENSLGSGVIVKPGRLCPDQQPRRQPGAGNRGACWPTGAMRPRKCWAATRTPISPC